MQLVTEVISAEIVSETGAVYKTERRTVLLTDAYALLRRRRAITLLELVGVGVCLNGGTELLRRAKVKVLDVVSVDRSSLRAARCLGYGRETVPSNTSSIGSVGGTHVENTVVNTGLVVALARLVPGNLSHFVFLS